MSRAWNRIFWLLAIISPVVGLVAAGAILTQLPEWPLPFLDPQLDDWKDTDFYLLTGGAVAGVLGYFFLGWLISLDPARERRPRLGLYLLGLGPGLAIGAGAWLAAAWLGYRELVITMPVMFGTALVAALLALLPDLIGSLVAGFAAALFTQLRFLGAASSALRLQHRFSPTHPTLNRKIGLLDFRRRAFAQALPRLHTQFESGDRTPGVLTALWESGWRTQHFDIAHDAAQAILEKPDILPQSSEYKLRRRLKDILLRREDWAEAVRVFAPAVEPTNPVDLEEIARLELRLQDYDKLLGTLKQLEPVEAPPHRRLDLLFTDALKTVDERTLPIVREYASFLQRQGRIEEEAGWRERLLEQEPRSIDDRERVIAVFREIEATTKLLAHLTWMVDEGPALLDAPRQYGKTRRQIFALEMVEVLIRLKEHDKAAGRAGMMSPELPDDPLIPYQLARVSLSKESFDEARGFVMDAERMLGIEPADLEEVPEEEVAPQIAAEPAEESLEAEEAQDDKVLHERVMPMPRRDGGFDPQEEEATYTEDGTLPDNAQKAPVEEAPKPTPQPAAPRAQESSSSMLAFSSSLPDVTPGVLRVLRRRIDEEEGRKRLAEAEAEVRENPDDVEARLRLVDRYLVLKRPERAVSEMDNFMDRLPDERDRLLRHLEVFVSGEDPPFILLQYFVDQLLKAGNVDRAHDIYEKMAAASFEKNAILEEGALRVLEKDETHVPSLLRLFHIRTEQKKWSDAADTLKRAYDHGYELDTLEKKAEALQTFAGAGDLDRGVPIGKEMIAAEPFNVRWHVLMAQLHVRNDQYEDALNYLARAKELEPGNNMVFKLLEDTRNRQREQRLLSIREQLGKDADNEELLEELGDLLIHFDRHEEAIRAFQRASQASSDEDDRQRRYSKLAHTMMRRRMFDTALETLREVPLSLRESKSSLNERKRLFYEVAAELEINNRIDEALELYKQVFKVDAGFRHVMDKMEKLGA